MPYRKDFPDCADKAECPHKLDGKCIISVHIPNGLHNDCTAQRFPNAKEKVCFT